MPSRSFEPLAALLAAPLARRAADPRPPAPGVLAQGPASALHVALDGLDTLAGRLLAGGRAGHDALGRTLDALYTALEETVTAHGGEILYFSAEALVAVLPAASPHQDGRPAEDVQRAFACALALQARLAAFLAIEAPPASGLTAPRVGVGAGEHIDLCAGDPARGLYYAGLGSALDEAAAAQAIAQPGEVVAGSGALGLALGMAELGLRTPFGLIAGAGYPEMAASGAPEPLPALAPAQLAPYLPGICERPAETLAPQTGEAAFLALRGPQSGSPHDTLAVHLLAYLPCLVSACTSHGAQLLELTVAERSLGVLLRFGGAPDDHLARAQRCAQELQGLATRFPWLAAQRIAVAAGPAFTGACGSPRRRCVLAAGTPVAEVRRMVRQGSPGPEP